MDVETEARLGALEAAITILVSLQPHGRSVANTLLADQELDNAIFLHASEFHELYVRERKALGARLLAGLSEAEK